MPPETHELISKMAKEMDVDQGKVLRWGIKTVIELTPLSQREEYRSGLSPSAKYLFDTLSKILS